MKYGLIAFVGAVVATLFGGVLTAAIRRADESLYEWDDE